MASSIFLFIVLSLLAILSAKSFSIELKRGANIEHSSSGHHIESLVIYSGPTYVMKVSIGSPPLETYAIMDTGSDLMWTQCFPCEDCYFQDIQIFQPTKSTTYKNLDCGSSSGFCPYNQTYQDYSETEGVMAEETFTFTSENKKSTTYKNIMFGCGHKNNGNFPMSASGVIGLGRGRLSLVSQLSQQLEKKFSYCLVEPKENFSSLLQIGSYKRISSDKLVSTPLLSKNSYPSFYYLILEGVSVGEKKIFNKKTPPHEGNIIIDSGTTLTHLDPELYQSLENLVRERIHLEPMEYPALGFQLCYETNSFNYETDIIMKFHFRGADIVLTKANLFVTQGEATCFSMIPTSGLQFYGNTAQINFWIEYDIGRKQLSFVPTNCTMHHQVVEEHNDGHKLSFLSLVVFILLFVNMLV